MEDDDEFNGLPDDPLELLNFARNELLGAMRKLDDIKVELREVKKPRNYDRVGRRKPRLRLIKTPKH